MVLVPPTPAPPLDVVEVPGVVGFVAGGDVLLVDEGLVDGVELLVGVLLEVLVEVLVDVGVELLELLELLDLQSLMASRATVLAPWLRFRESVVLTVVGRLVTALVSAAAALLAAPH
jgi:hypothetical protein